MSRHIEFAHDAGTESKGRCLCEIPAPPYDRAAFCRHAVIFGVTGFWYLGYYLPDGFFIPQFYCRWRWPLALLKAIGCDGSCRPTSPSIEVAAR